MDRKLFSKIRSNRLSTPKKDNILALCLALNLNMEEASDLLGRAGYSFSPGRKTDVIIEYCIEKKKYNIFDVNMLLAQYDLPSLGE